MKLNKAAFGLSLGILFGVAVFFATMWTVARGGGEHLTLLNQFYIGYTVSYTGAIIGLVYGFIEGFIGGWLVAWLYNLFAAQQPT